ncbi:MAG: hypothetical protein WD512_14705 [Candidatus Paceibacterota bacterium]
MLQKCSFSGESFAPKRKNQVFANAKNRRDFHNKNAAELRRIKSPIDRQLEKNFLIFSELVQIGEIKKFSKDDLLMKGYNPTFFTHLTNHGGKNSRCIYHFILPPSDNPNFITVIYPKHD